MSFDCVFEFLPKLVGVGKSCLLLRFSDDSFTPSFITTIGYALHLILAFACDSVITYMFVELISKYEPLT